MTSTIPDIFSPDPLPYVDTDVLQKLGSALLVAEHGHLELLLVGRRHNVGLLVLASPGVAPTNHYGLVQGRWSVVRLTKLFCQAPETFVED